MKILVYVEGHSDRAGPEALLRRLVAAGQEPGVGLRFLPQHDKTALMLACPDQLRRCLGTVDALEERWRRPVEEQNDEHPPKSIVKRLFRRYRPKRGYVDTKDAPWILERADLSAVEEACPQCFAPFVADLRRVLQLPACAAISRPSDSAVWPRSAPRTVPS